MAGTEDTEPSERPWRMPDAYRHFLRPRRPSEIFVSERVQQGAAAPDDLDAEAGETDHEPA